MSDLKVTPNICGERVDWAGQTWCNGPIWDTIHNPWNPNYHEFDGVPPEGAVDETAAMRKRLSGQKDHITGQDVAIHRHRETEVNLGKALLGNCDQEHEFPRKALVLIYQPRGQEFNRLCADHADNHWRNRLGNVKCTHVGGWENLSDGKMRCNRCGQDGTRGE